MSEEPAGEDEGAVAVGRVERAGAFWATFLVGSVVGFVVGFAVGLVENARVERAGAFWVAFLVRVTVGFERAETAVVTS